MINPIEVNLLTQKPSEEAPPLALIRMTHHIQNQKLFPKEVTLDLTKSHPVVFNRVDLIAVDHHLTGLPIAQLQSIVADQEVQIPLTLMHSTQNLNQPILKELLPMEIQMRSPE